MAMKKKAPNPCARSDAAVRHDSCGAGAAPAVARPTTTFGKEGRRMNTDWWEKRRLRYNVGLVIAGIFAFVAYAIVCTTLLPEEADVEITVFTTLFQGLGYLVMIGIANLCFFLGPISERALKPADLDKHRQIFYRLGFGFSVLLPFSIPVLLAVT
jgi:hypothetical protein